MISSPSVAYRLCLRSSGAVGLTMHRAAKSTITARVALGIAVALALGCDSSGPEFAGGETRIVEGRLDGETASKSDFFVITRSGTVSIQLTSLLVVDEETGEPIDIPGLGLSIGQPNSNDPTICQPTFSQFLEPGGSFAVFYPEGLFCVIAVRGPEGPIATVIDYVLTLTGAFS